MKSKLGLLVIAAAGVGAALLLSKKSSAAQSGLPAGWTPPDGASFSEIQPGGTNPTGLVLNVWRWADPGNTGGTQALVTNAANSATDFAAFFIPATAGANPQLLTVGTTPNSGLIAQAGVAGLIQ